MTTNASPMMLLDRMYNAATSETDKGDRFEQFVQSFLQQDPTWADQFAHVWRWDDWPGRTGHDVGVDLVAERREDSSLVAIQCKFYAPDKHIAKTDIDSFLAASGRVGFDERIIVSTTTKWGPNAEQAIRDQAVPVRRLGLDDLEHSRIDWANFDPETPTAITLTEQSDLRPYQRTAIDAVADGFQTGDRGRMIMACGTGKTFTSLRLAEQQVGAGGSVLFLVPSIALLSQALREWSNQTRLGITPLAVCSDAKASRGAKRSDDTSEISVVDLALPATTDPSKVAQRMRQTRATGEGMRVVFATYQSIDVVAQAQQLAGLEPFDLIVCDEAHRTTGATLSGSDESAFVKVHDSSYIHGSKRLYMTATPRIYDDASKAKAGKAQAVLASMDDEDTYGPEMYRLGFGEAVGMGMLTDYKVLILTVNQDAVSESLQTAFAEDGELTLDDATRLIGCWNGLAKRGDSEHSFASDPQPMRRAVAFARDIKSSKKVRDQFNTVVDAYAEATEDDAAGDLLRVEVDHVDGSMNAMERNRLLDWLREPTDGNTSRVLSNARCLSEGVDVPALDSVMFLNPRRSVVDVVQSVGRVMRLSPGKKYGYIILPVVVEAGLEPEQALNQNKNFEVVWEVLQALRAHDERFDAMVNQVELNRDRSDKVDVIGVGFPGDENGDGGQSATEGAQGQIDLQLSRMDGLRDAIYARMVKKVGSRTYWDQWAKDIADIAQAHITRITRLVDDPTTDASAQFAEFLDALRRTLNESITRSGAIDMLAQHMITKPVFDALFENYEFTKSNSVSRNMDRMVGSLTAMHVDAEANQLEAFYESVRVRAAGIDNAAGKQKIITELYESFFQNAFAKTADAMGVVYTPVEIVDFILRAVNDVLQSEFGISLTDEGVHVLDPFTGTGTFIVRLLQSGLIKPEDLARKYASELHANEILLLAYYIAAINIETTFHDLAAKADGVELADEKYEPFEGIVLTDTFQQTEDGDLQDEHVFPTNNARAELQKAIDVRVIVGNPPWRVGQKSGNDANANIAYPTLDGRISDTYLPKQTRGLQRNTYDAYIRALRWASDRVGNRGVIGLVTNSGWLDSKSAADLRNAFQKEFSAIYILDLRGDLWAPTKVSKREGENVFGVMVGSAICILVKDASKQDCRIRYIGSPDYASKQDKLRFLDTSYVASKDWKSIAVSDYGDWLSPRDPIYTASPSLGNDSESEANVFHDYWTGILTNRDKWAYASSEAELSEKLDRMIETYQEESSSLEYKLDRAGLPRVDQKTVAPLLTSDPKAIKWDRSLRNRLLSGKELTRNSTNVRTALYRPFFLQIIDSSNGLLSQPGVIRDNFPNPGFVSPGIWTVGPGSAVPFCAFATKFAPDLHLTGAGSGGNFYPRYRWVLMNPGEIDLLDDSNTSDGYRREDNVSDDILQHIQRQYDKDATKDDIFFFVYGLMHSPTYQLRFGNELKKMLPRLPEIPAESFRPFVDSGRELFTLHSDYEDVSPYPLGVQGGEQPLMANAGSYYRVEKMVFPKGQKAVDAPSKIILNPHLTVTGIPESAYRYQLGARSGIEWVMRQYQVTTDKASGIVNDPNQWGLEHGNPRYILDLLGKVVAVSVQTMEIVDGLPPID